ncbi:MAG: hypothetical protein HFE86_00330 [Clostridiales bacterium]|nr:hypothetical protein [Clostridiales bacterium]
MCDIVNQIEGISGKEDFLTFVNQLIADVRQNPQEWNDTTIGQYLEAMRLEDYSACAWNDIDWSRVSYAAMAKFYTWESSTSKLQGVWQAG